MSEKTTQQLRDEVSTSAIEAVEARREAERLREMNAELRAQLADARGERDEARRELAQTLASERAVRRRVALARIDGQPYLATADLEQDLAAGEVP